MTEVATPEPALRCHRFLAQILLVGLCIIAAPAFATSYGPPDTRSWEQVTADFLAREGRHANDGEYDGRRLKELDARKAAAFLIPLLAKDQPYALRVKAIGALGWSSFQEAIPALSAIAMDASDNEEIRAEALNPGLRYMKHSEAVKTATALTADKSVRIRNGAYWVLSGHGTDDAIEVLAARLQAKDAPLIEELINALTYSEHPRAGKLVFEHVDFSVLPHDEPHLSAYSIAMEHYRIPEARQNMLILAKQRDMPLSCFYALRYFGAFPREDVVPTLIAYIEAKKPVNDLYETVTEFIKSPAVGKKSKSKLSAFLASGTVQKPDPVYH
jgi:hypothetical protein